MKCVGQLFIFNRRSSSNCCFT